MAFIQKLKNGWIRIDTPSPDIWCDQSTAIHPDNIDRVRLVKKLTNGGPDNGVEISSLQIRDVLGYRVWVRCKTPEEALALYEELLDYLPD